MKGKVKEIFKSRLQTVNNKATTTSTTYYYYDHHHHYHYCKCYYYHCKCCYWKLLWGPDVRVALTPCSSKEVRPPVMRLRPSFMRLEIFNSSFLKPKLCGYGACGLVRCSCGQHSVFVVFFFYCRMLRYQVPPKRTMGQKNGESFLAKSQCEGISTSWWFQAFPKISSVKWDSHSPKGMAVANSRYESSHPKGITKVLKSCWRSQSTQSLWALKNW